MPNSAVLDAPAVLETKSTPEPVAGNSGMNNLPPGANDDFAYLDEPVMMPEGIDPALSIEEAEALAEKEEAEAAKDKPTVEVDKTETPKPEDKPADTSPDVEMAKEKANAWDTFNNVLEQNPAELAKFVLSKMSPADQTALLRDVAPALLDPEAPEPFDADAWEPVGDLETAVKARWSHIEDLPNLAAKVKSLEGQIAESSKGTIERLDVTITRTAIQSEILFAKYDAIAQALGIDLPDPDMNAIIEALKDGRTTFRSAVRGVLGDKYKNSVEVHKQRNAQRPNTPGNGTTRPEKLREGATLLECVRALGN